MCFSAGVRLTDEKQPYVRELGEVGHLDLGQASQDLHQVDAFVCLEPADDGDEEAGRKRRRVEDRKKIN